MKKPKPNIDDAEWVLTIHLTKFVNAAFGRRLRPSLGLYDAIVSASESGYSRDEIRLAFWVARCMAGEAWLKSALQKDMNPEIVLRHKGHINPKTGQPAKRWLDELISRANETNPVLVGAVLAKLPESFSEERELLKRMEVAFDEH